MPVVIIDDLTMLRTLKSPIGTGKITAQWLTGCKRCSALLVSQVSLTTTSQQLSQYPDQSVVIANV